MATTDHAAPTRGEKITISDGKLTVPNQPVIPFIRGDGTGPDIWASSVRVLDAAVEKAYGGQKKIVWHEVFAGQAAKDKFDNWLPDETVEAFRDYLVGIKGPLTTPVGGGIRSLNVALRQMLDLYVCLRPVQYFTGVPSPVKRPEKVDMVIFRENTEDIYAGIEYKAGTPTRRKCWSSSRRSSRRTSRRSASARRRPPPSWSMATKPRPSRATGSPTRRWKSASASSPSAGRARERLVRAAIEYAIEQKRKSVTLVHKGNIMKYTEGAFRDWGYDVADTVFAEQTYSWAIWEKTKAASGEAAANDEMKAASKAGKIIVKDAIADITLQQVLTRPEDFDVIATLNLNGDYLSDALAAQVGGIGIAPGGNINYRTGHAIFEATHGTAPEVRRSRQGQPRLGHPLGRDDVPLPGLDRGGGPDHQGPQRRDCQQESDVRFRAADGRRDRGKMLGVRRRNHRGDVNCRARPSSHVRARFPIGSPRPGGRAVGGHPPLLRGGQPRF